MATKLNYITTKGYAIYTLLVDEPALSLEDFKTFIELSLDFMVSPTDKDEEKLNAKNDFLNERVSSREAYVLNYIFHTLDYAHFLKEL